MRNSLLPALGLAAAFALSMPIISASNADAREMKVEFNKHHHHHHHPVKHHHIHHPKKVWHKHGSHKK